MSSSAASTNQACHQLLTRRRAGILLHVTSLPGPDGVGDLGSNAYRFVDFLVSAGMSVWQILPIGPTMHDNSPYQSSSVYAGNPRLISLEMPRERGWLEAAPLEGKALTEQAKMYHIRLAWEGFKERASKEDRSRRRCALPACGLPFADTKDRRH